MKIELRNMNSDPEKLILSDEGFDGAGWVEIIIKNDEDEDVFAAIDIHITDLFPALTAFKASYEEQRKRDKEDEEI